MFRKIKSKKLELVVYIVLLFVFIMLLSGGINIFNSCKIINNQANQNFISITDGVRKSFNRYFRTAEEETEHCKRMIELTVDSKKISEIAPVAYKYTKNNVPYVNEYLKSMLSPILLYSATHVDGLESIYFDFDHEYLINKDLIGLWYVDTKGDGKFHVVDNGLTETMYPKTRSDLEWFYLPKKLKNGVWSRPYLDSDLKIDMITYSAPVYAKGKFLGIIGIDISMEKIKDFIYKFDKYKTGKIYLINRENKIIFSKEHKNLEKSDAIDSYLYKFLDENYVKKHKKSQETQVRLIKSFNHKLFATVSLYNGFILVVEVSSKELYGEITRLIVLTSFSLLFMVTISIFVAMAAYSKVKKINNELLHKEKLISIGTLTAGIAHEINNPLGYVKCNIDTLKNYVERVKKFLLFGEIEVKRSVNNHPFLQNELEDLENIKSELKIDYVLDNIEDLVEDSREGINRVSDIILNLKNFSKNDSQNFKSEECLESIVEEALNLLKSKIPKEILIVKSFDVIPPLYCNKNGLVQVLVNMLDNAFQSFDEEIDKSKKIVISIYKKGKNACIEIEDNGNGIEKSKINRIFESFYTTKAQGQGTGLGLSIAYEIITGKHGGDILVESEKGKGTKFIIKLPYQKRHNKGGNKNGL